MTKSPKQPGKATAKKPAPVQPIAPVVMTPAEVATPLRGMASALVHIDEAPFIEIPTQVDEEAATTVGDEEAEGIYGSSTLPSQVKMGGKEVPLGDAVNAAFEKSGLSVSEWNSRSAEELDALISAEIDPEEPVVVEEETIYSFLKQKFPRMETIPAKVKEVIEGLEHYSHDMNPMRPTDALTGAQHQRGLLYTFITALNQDGSVSKVAVECILWYFRKHSASAFGPLVVYRFMASNKMSASELDCLRALLNLFLATAKVETRREALKKNISMRRVVETLTNERQRENLLNFYS